MNRKLLRWYPYTSVALALALLVLVAAVVWHINVFHLPGVNFIGIEETEAGEILIAFLLVIPAFFVDRVVGRQRTEEAERVRFALAAVRTGVWEWDLNSDAVTWSSTTALAFGVSPEKAPTSGREFLELVHPDDREALGESSDRAIRDRTDLVSEFRTNAMDGGVRWVQVHGRGVYDTDGKPLRLLGVSIDISERKSLEEQLLDAQRQADRLRVLKATMRTVQDIVSNALMSLYEFRLEAEPNVSPQSLELFDRIIAETAAKLKMIADLETVGETEMVMGQGIEYQSTRPAELVG